jgi:hypothetical protein
MIDCGATENFIDREYARQNQIPLLRKAVPRHCLAVDGTEVLGGPITHEALLDVTINNHEETVRLQCITIGNSSVILGLPWLRKHNPAIDWRENRVSFNSEYCAKKCLDTSPHAVTVPEDKATQEYFKKTPLDGEPRLLGGEVGGPASRSRVTTGVVDVVVVFALLFARFLCRWGLLSFCCSFSFSFGQWGSFSIQIGILAVVRSNLHFTSHISDRPPPPILP